MCSHVALDTARAVELRRDLQLSSMARLLPVAKLNILAALVALAPVRY